MDRLAQRTELGVSIDKHEDCPTCSICWNCDIASKDCRYIDDALNKLAEYEDLEEQGLLLRLPVPIGTTVYKFEPLAKGAKKYIKTTITRYEVFEDSIWFTFANGLGRNIKDFGKTVFLTQAEAEQKLKEMNTDNGITE